MKTLALAFLLSGLAGCAPLPHPDAAEAPALALRGTDGQVHVLKSEAAQAPATVFVFFDPNCPCMTAHEPRIKALYDELASRGVRWFMVDSEAGGSLERDQTIAKDRGYAFPILLDENGTLAKAMGAESASYSVVLDRAGHVQYAGGVDDDRSHLRDDATPFLHDALVDVLDGKTPRRTSGKALGCALKLW
ncbi:MAG TPA: redoxin domain-containing protein [Polyangiaceae bacterium]